MSAPLSRYSIRMLQARCATLGHWPGPIDGKLGPRTQAALAAATAAQKARGLPLVHPSGISMIRWHWSGGWRKPNAGDRKHYHALYHGDGTEELLFDWAKHLAHTQNANAGAVALSLCGMAQAIERPFTPGPEPITLTAIDAMLTRSAKLCRIYDIPVCVWSVNTHAEVQPVLGIAQRQKWDINWLPGMAAPSDPTTTGNRLRDMLAAKLRVSR